MFVRWKHLKPSSRVALLMVKISSVFKRRNQKLLAKNVLGRLPFVRIGRPERTGPHQCKRSRPVHAITQAILAWNTRKSWCKKHGGFSYETFKHFFATLSRRRIKFCFWLIGKKNWYFFFSVVCIFSRRKLAKITDYSKLTIPLYRFRWLQEPLANDIHNIGATY